MGANGAQADELTRARAALQRLGVAAQVVAIEPPVGGISGATTVRVTLRTGQAVLKLLASERELRFYRELGPRLPIGVPALLAADADVDSGGALLLRAYGPPRELTALSEMDLEAVVASLAAVHAAYWGQADLQARHPWLGPPPVPATAEEYAHAEELWRIQAGYAPLQGAITPATLAALPGWFAVLQRAEARLAGYPLTLVHGDCHLGNVLWSDDGAPVLADWAQAGVGLGPGDMSFLLQRACGPADDAAFARWAARYAARLAEVAPGQPDPAWTLQLMGRTSCGCGYWCGHTISTGCRARPWCIRRCASLWWRSDWPRRRVNAAPGSSEGDA